MLYSPGFLGPLMQLNIGMFVLHFPVYLKQFLISLAQVIVGNFQGYRACFTIRASDRYT